MLVDLDASDDVGGHGQAVAQFLETGQEHLLDNLQVAEVSAGQVVHDEHDLLRECLYLVALGACELKHVGVLLVGHDAGARGALVGELHEGEVLTVEQAGVKGQLAQRARHAGQREGHVALHLSASHLCIHHVVVHGVEAQKPCGHLAVKRETASVACRRAQGVAVGHAVGGLQEHHVIHQALGVSPKPQPETAGHGHLQVCVSRHEHLPVPLALCLQFGEEGAHVLGHQFQLAACEELQVHQHLVVAAASRVYLLAHVAQPPCEHELYLRVHVLHTLLDAEVPRKDFPAYGAQFGEQCLQFTGREQSDAFQHGDVGHAAQHVALGQVEVHLTVSAHGEAFYLLGCAEALVP